MAAMANFLVKDDATSPVEWTLVPVTDTPNPFWRAVAAGIPLEGEPRLTFSSERLKDGSYKLSAKLELPTMETLGASGTSAGYVAPPKVAYITTGFVTLFVNARSTIADRYNALKMLIGAVQGASSTTATGVLSNTAAGDAWKNSTLPGPLFFGQLVVPN
jgi:hypothetical protein